MLRSKPRLARRGLSTLEMALALPILLMIMALMINFGTVASWKLRGLGVSRNAVFSTRWPRSGNTDPRPAYWPTQAGISHGGAGSIATLDHPNIDHPVVRGPLPLEVQVRRELLDPSRGLRVGSSSLTRRFPMMGSLGEYHLQSQTYLLDDCWQYQRMGMPGNRYRRTDVIYIFPERVPLKDDYTTAAVANYYGHNNLIPMVGGEQDVARWGWLAQGRGPTPGNFVPGLPSFCSLDQDVATEAVDQLIDRIDGVARNMVRTYIAFYNAVITGVNAQDPPLPDGQAIISEAQGKIQQLEQDLQALGG